MSDSRSTSRGTRGIHLPRAAGLLLAIPVLLALGVASIVVFFVAVIVVFLAPFLRSRRYETLEPPPESGTITLDPGAYRTVPGTGADAERSPAVRAPRPGR
jgi:hypothetical protein